MYIRIDILITEAVEQFGKTMALFGTFHFVQSLLHVQLAIFVLKQGLQHCGNEHMLLAGASPWEAPLLSEAFMFQHYQWADTLTFHSLYHH